MLSNPPSRSLGRGRLLTAQFALLLAASLPSSWGCSSNKPAAATVIGEPDRPDDGAVSIDELALQASLADGALTVKVPVTSLVAHTASGTLDVALVSVDGKKVMGSAKVRYTLGSKESDTLEVDVPAPAGITTQADLVEYNLRIADQANAGLRVTRSLLYVLPLYELRLEGPAKLRKGREGSYRVRVEDTRSRQPLEGEDVTIEVVSDGKVVQSQTATTEVTGVAEVQLNLEDHGNFEIRARLESQGTSAEVSGAVAVDATVDKLLLTTDKPIYQPGQVINLRALALAYADNKPITKSKVTFEVEDGKGNKVLKRTVNSNAFGVAFTTFTLGNIVNEGTYKCRVLQGEATSEKTVEVSHYALPKFEVALATAEPWYEPGTIVHGSLDARYFFGKRVTGQVVLEALSLDVGETLFQRVMGTLDADGHYDFSVQLPAVLSGLDVNQGNAAVLLRATVTDSAGQSVQKTSTVAVSRTGATLLLVPEAGELVPGIENSLLLFATDPLGAPLADKPVTLTGPDGAELETTTDEFGQATLSWTAPALLDANSSFRAALALEGGRFVNAVYAFEAQAGEEHVVVRTDKSVYDVGETVEVSVVSSEPNGTVYVDWLNDGQTVDMRTLTAKHGRAKFSTTLDSALGGNNRIEAYVVDAQGNIARAGRTVFARSSGALQVEVSADQETYAPGAPARLQLSVRDEHGEPAVAALGLQIVDQAVFALVDARPGLLRSYFELNDTFAKPTYEIQGPDANFESLLFQDTAARDAKKAEAAQRTTEAALAAMKNTSLTGIAADSLGTVLAGAKEKLRPYQEVARAAIHEQLEARAHTIVGQLAIEQCSAEVSICPRTGKSFNDSFSAALLSGLEIYDFWGNVFEVDGSYGGLTLLGAGPDEREGTADDVSLSFSLQELAGPIPPRSGDDGQSSGGPGLPGNGMGTGTGGASAGPAAGASGGRGGSGGSASGPAPGTNEGESSAGPRVRREFPETLYVNPSIITDEAGKATIEVGMADSITEWRVSALANSQNGRLGGGEGKVRVFQDFFVDVDFPAALTRGDAVTFPIAVYNYLDTPQTVSLELTPGTWYRALGPTTTRVELAPGQVKGVSFPVRVDEVGVRSLTVVATGTKKSDAVARTVRVVSDGKAFPAAVSGSIEAGLVQASATFPANAIAGSQSLLLDIFPAFSSQAVAGMDSILATPSGCFEQTTSTAWPNVLVTHYLNETKQVTPEIALKAEALMSAGYQRLLTFEHPGGGFSWFGTQDPAPLLSVTAFGLMEFADMAQVQTVDEAMLARTIAWLSSKQQADGSFPGDQTEFFSFNTSVLRNTAFTAWSLASAGQQGGAVERALSYTKANLGTAEDAYTLGVVANLLALAEPNGSALSGVLSKLEASKKKEGASFHWDAGESQTSFYGAGDDAAVTSTALVAHALLLAGGHVSTAEGALDYIIRSRDPRGNFGSTQATIWSLRALLLAASKGTDGAVGELTVAIDGVPKPALQLSKAQAEVVTRIDLSDLATTGTHAVELGFTGTGKVSYNLVSSYNLPWSASEAVPPGPLSIAVGYDKSSLFVDDAVKATVTVKNLEAVTQNMVLLTLGIPPGFTVNTADLEPYLDAGQISRFEVTGRQLIVYVTKIEPRATLQLSYSLTATLPVSAVDGGAEATLYYEPKRTTRAAAHSLEVIAR